LGALHPLTIKTNTKIKGRNLFMVVGFILKRYEISFIEQKNLSKSERKNIIIR